jgi:hypothetical protein
VIRSHTRSTGAAIRTSLSMRSVWAAMGTSP